MDADKKTHSVFGLLVTEIRVKMHFPGRAFLVMDTADIPKVFTAVVDI